MFQVKKVCELKLEADSDNVNLILIWSHHHFHQKNLRVPFRQKYLKMEFLKMRCRIPSSNFLVIQVPVLEVLKNCSLSTVSNTGT